MSEREIKLLKSGQFGQPCNLFDGAIPAQVLHVCSRIDELSSPTNMGGSRQQRVVATGGACEGRKNPSTFSGQTSPLLSDLFCLRSVSTTHRTARLTRSQVSNGLVLPNVSRRFGLHSLSYLAAVKWNSAPPDIRNATSLHALRIQLSTWLGHPVRRPIGL